MLWTTLALTALTFDHQLFFVDNAVHPVDEFWHVDDVHTLTGDLPDDPIGAAGTLTGHCLNGTIADYSIPVILAAHRTDRSGFLNVVWNATVTLGGVAYGAQLAYSHSQQPNHTSSYLVVYANDDGNPQPASIGFLVYGGIPAPPPPPPPACITSYTKAACDSCAEACSWCASADGVHALCFDETDTPATGWSCD